MKWISPAARLRAIVALAWLGGAASAVVVERITHGNWGALSLVALAGLLSARWLARSVVAPIRHVTRALSAAIESYRCGDFNQSLVIDHSDELGSLQAAINELGEVLREQRQHLVQREFLLDTIVQNSPVAILLIDEHRRIAYANIATQQLLGNGVSIQDANLDALLASSTPILQQAIGGVQDSLLSVNVNNIEETLHISSRVILLKGIPHRLYLLKPITRELARQEVATWKRLIRVVSHEINNSLAPISSLAHTGMELSRRQHVELLAEVFSSIGERARHLHKFIQSYAAVSRLPAPRPLSVAWPQFLDSLRSHTTFTIAGSVPASSCFDPVQMEQVLINLIKNAHESGSAPEAIELEVCTQAGDVQIEVRDRGSGMSETVLTNALLPFYSTKRTGSGIGLALAREVIEAHGGRLTLSNRDGGGLSVRMQLP